MKRFNFTVFFLLVAVLMIGIVGVAAAQDAVSTPSVEDVSVIEIISPSPADGGTVVVVSTDAPPVTPNAGEAVGLAEVLIAAVLASSFGTAPVTTFIVSLLKRVLPGVSARHITVVVALILSAVTAAATYLGYGVQLNSLLEVISTAGPSLVGFIVTLIGAPAYFNLAKAADAPVLSYSRTPEPQ